MRLTEIQPLGDSGVYLLRLGETTLRCSEKELFTYGLRAGLELEADTLLRLEADCRAFAVRRKAAELLSRRAMSAGELQQKLLEKGAAPADAEAAVARLLELGAIDEAAYAAMVVRHYSARGYGRRRLEQELYRHRLPRALWEQALAEAPEGGEVLDRLVRQKLRGDRTPDGDTLRRLAAALCRKGYGWEEVRAAIARVTEADPED